MVGTAVKKVIGFCRAGGIAIVEEGIAFVEEET